MRNKKAFMFICIILILTVAISVVAVHTVDVDNQKFFNIAKKYKQDKSLVAVVGNEKIYQYQIDIQRSAQELSKKNAVEMGADETTIIIQTDDEILENLIRNEVILQEAKSQKLTAKYSDAKKQQEEYFSSIIASDDEQAKFLEEYREAMGWSEKEHIKHASVEWQNTLTRANLKSKFFEDNVNASEQDYEKYIDVLLENADIEYK